MTSPLSPPISARHVSAAQLPPGHRILAHLQKGLRLRVPKNVALGPFKCWDAPEFCLRILRLEDFCARV